MPYSENRRPVAPDSSLLGTVWETFLFSEMGKLNAAAAYPVNFWYYRDQRAREIDLVLQRGGRLSFVECKWQENPAARDAGSLLAVSEELAASPSPWRASSSNP